MQLPPQHLALATSLHVRTNIDTSGFSILYTIPKKLGLVAAQVLRIERQEVVHKMPSSPKRCSSGGTPLLGAQMQATVPISLYAMCFMFAALVLCDIINIRLSARIAGGVGAPRSCMQGTVRTRSVSGR